MAKEKGLKPAGPRLKGMWKQDARDANPGASPEQLAKIVNDRAKKEGFDYTITADKFEVKVKGQKKRGRPPGKTSTTAVHSAQAQTNGTPSVKPAAKTTAKTAGALIEDLKTFVGLVGKDGAKNLVSDMIDQM